MAVAKLSAKRGRAGFRRFFTYLEEVELVEPLREILKRHHVSLLDVYGDDVGTANFAARLECFWHLMRLGRSAPEIARLFDRHADSVSYGLRLLRDESGMQGVILDEDGVYRVARAVAEKCRAGRRAAGKRAAEGGNLKKGPAKGKNA